MKKHNFKFKINELIVMENLTFIIIDYKYKLSGGARYELFCVEHPEELPTHFSAPFVELHAERTKLSELLYG